MNLIFEVAGPSHAMQEFPFQTPTDLTYAVLATENKLRQYVIIETWVRQSGWPPDIQDDMIERCHGLILSPYLTLTIV